MQLSADGSLGTADGDSRSRGLSSWVVGLLIAPAGLSSGYTTVTLVFLLTQAGLRTAAIGAFLAAVLAPTTFKFLWAPLIDATLGPRRWYLIGVAALTATLSALAFVPVGVAGLPLITALAVANTVAFGIVTFPVEIIMAYDVPPERKGRASGWYQATYQGGSAIGGGAALYLSQQGLPAWLPALSLAVACAACAPFVRLAAPRPPALSDGNGITGLLAIARDVWAFARSRLGPLTLLLAILPIGSGALINLFPALAADWRAGADVVALLSGAAGGVSTLVGSLAGGWICDRVDRRAALCGLGLLLSAVAAAMALGPRTPMALLGFGLLYALVAGAALAAFTAAMLDALGRGAAATKYTLLGCIGQVSYIWLASLDAGVHDHSGAAVMLLTEAAVGVAAVAVFAAAAMFATWWRQRGVLVSAA